jgi:hypothetical protein
VVRQRALF